MSLLATYALIVTVIALVATGLFVIGLMVTEEDGKRIRRLNIKWRQAEDAYRRHLAGCGLATVTRIHPDHEPTPIGDAAHDAAVFNQMTDGLDERPGRETFPDTFGGA